MVDWFSLAIYSRMKVNMELNFAIFSEQTNSWIYIGPNFNSLNF